MKTKVVNRHFDKYDVYIGYGTKWANPFIYEALVESKYKLLDAHEDSRTFYNICEQIDDYEDAFCILGLDKIIDLPDSYLTYTDV